MRSLLLLCLLIFSAAGLADTWGGRLQPTVDSIERATWSPFSLSCLNGEFIEIQTPKYKASGPLDPLLVPRKTCLEGIFESTRYYRRHQQDPVAYRTVDGKPYLELFFSGAGKYAQGDAPQEPPQGKTRYSLKIILHDFKGKGRYPVYHQNETFKPRYDEKQPIARTENGMPYLNYAEGRGIPLILGNFAALRESTAFTFSTGARLYGDYDAQQLAGVIPKGGQLGEVVIDNIDKAGKIDGSFSLRMLHETCSDVLAISQCKLRSNQIRGNFTAEPFKPNKQAMEANLDGSQTKPRVKLKPRKELKPRVGGQQANTQGSDYANLIVIDVPQPRMHKPLLGYNCPGAVSTTCRGADATFEKYLACMDENNFAKNKTRDTAKIAAAKQALQGCARIYDNYARQSTQCKQLFIEDENCTQ
jgi:hypothetical protein